MPTLTIPEELGGPAYPDGVETASVPVSRRPLQSGSIYTLTEELLTREIPSPVQPRYYSNRFPADDYRQPTFTANMRPFTARNGRSVNSLLTDDEAVRILLTLRGEFSEKLAADFRRYGRLTPAQMVWAHILAMETVREVESERPYPGTRAAAQVFGMSTAPVTGVQDNHTAPTSAYYYRGIVDFLEAAAVRVREGRRSNVSPSSPVRLRIRLLAGTQKIVLDWTSGRSNIFVNDGGRWEDRRTFGTISVLSGAWDNGRHPLAEIHDLLQLLSADPEAAARAYGRATNTCCFCGSDLSDERSTEMGYGPTCATTFNLPWGAVGVDSRRRAQRVNRAVGA